MNGSMIDVLFIGIYESVKLEQDRPNVVLSLLQEPRDQPSDPVDGDVGPDLGVLAPRNPQIVEWTMGEVFFVSVLNFSKQLHRSRVVDVSALAQESRCPLFRYQPHLAG